MMECSFNHIKPKYINLNSVKGVGGLGMAQQKKNQVKDDHQKLNKLYFGKKNPH